MSGRTRRGAPVLVGAALVVLGLAGFLPIFPASAEETGDAAVTRTVTATRTFLDADGTQTEASSNKVTLEVEANTDLRGRQEIHVAWQGAHPTGGIVSDPHSSEARNQEYPFVLLQCRGVDTSAGVPKGQTRLSPETCWTQTSTERYLAASSHTPSWRFDAWASAAQRRAVVGAPDPLPDACAGVSEPLSARWLPFRARGGKVYYGGPDPSVGCTGLAPESDSAEAGGLPSNTTYGVTGTDGKGAADFAVWTAAENASLGCSASVSCALVAVPIVGVSCDAFGTRLGGTAQTTKTGTPLSTGQLETADATCRRAGAYEAGTARSSQSTDQAVRGNLWWSESNWRNRITVPLTFAATGAICDVVSDEAPVQFMGSVLLNELTASWRPTFCTTDDLFAFTHVQQADALARNLLNVGEIDAAFTTAPREGGYSRPVVQAPTAFGGFAISFNIDDAENRRRSQLNLNARLVAKLLSSSYPAVPVMRDNHPSIGANPLNITLDPEFQALNPGLPKSSTIEAAAALQVFSSSSDLVWALTSWLDADAEARDWLNGDADPWGMTVNAAYRRIDLPLDNWPLLDTFVAPQYYQDQNACYANSPTAFMQLIANPAANLSAVLLNMQYANSAVATVCRYDGYDQTTLPLRQQGHQTTGYRFVLGLTSLSSARRYNLRTAALQTTSSVKADQEFTSAAGRTFVTPSDASLKAAAQLLTPDPDAGQWHFDHAALATEDGAAAYPGAVPIYTAIPTEGLTATTAERMARFLCYSGSDGQSPGRRNGQLPAGYLPLTTSNGMGDQARYLGQAVTAVRAQKGDVPSLDAEGPSLATACDFSTKPVKPTTDDPDDVAAVPLEPAAPVAPVADEPGKADPQGTAPAPVSTDQITLTAGERSAFGRFGLPGVVMFAVACALAGALLRWYDVLRVAVSTLATRGSGAAGGRGGARAAGRSRRR